EVIDLKIVQIGCNHAGTWSAKTILKNKKEEDELIIFDSNDNISFLGCGIALWVSGLVKDTSELFYANEKEFKDMGATIKMKHKVLNVDSKKKEVLVENLEDKTKFVQSYDKLIVAGGSWPIIPPFPGINLKNVLLSKLYQHGQVIVDKANDPNVKKVAIIGAGYIGVELAEAFEIKGKEVYLIEMQDRVCANVFDYDIAKHLNKAIEKDSKTNLLLNSKVEEFVGDDNGVLKAIKLDKNRVIDIDLAIVCIGFLPNVKSILNDAVDLDPRGAIITNRYYQSSNPDIYAIGDCATHIYNPNDSQPIAMMLATNAIRSGVTAGYNVTQQNTLKSRGIQGSNAIHVWNWTLAGAGMTEAACAMPWSNHKNVKSILIEDTDKYSFIKDNEKIYFKVVYDDDTKEIIGCQVASKNNHSAEMYLMSMAIEQKVKIHELALIDCFFLPHFNKAVSWLIKPSLKYLNLI
ncbi:MAG: NADH oxidase, partial [Mycoplasma sp.]|nr:NADH oxidase [Mycoplasma sp.]